MALDPSFVDAHEQEDGAAQVEMEEDMALSSPPLPFSNRESRQGDLPQERCFAVMALRCPAPLLCLHWSSMTPAA